jgi:hypothetical protein
MVRTMPITPVWDDDKETIIRFDYSDPVESWAEYHLAMKAGNQLALNKSYTVDMIHVAGKTRMPKGSAFPALQRAIRELPENVNLVISIIEDNFARSVTSLAIRTFSDNNKLKLARSLDEARLMVQRNRENS